MPANACWRECTCKCRAAVRLSRGNVRRVTRAAGVSRPGRVFMAEKIFYHNNTEIRRASRPFSRSLSLFLSSSFSTSFSVFFPREGTGANERVRGPCTYIKRGLFLLSPLLSLVLSVSFFLALSRRRGTIA